MKLPIFIARRLMQKNAAQKKFSGPIVRISIVTIALSLAVMLLSVSIVQGFKAGITTKITGIAAHYRITAAQTTLSYESVPFSSEQPWTQSIEQLSKVKFLQRYATKLGILKTEKDIQGALVKGVGEEFSWSFFQEHLEEGVLPAPASKEVLLSSVIARRLNLSIADSVQVYYLKRDSLSTRPRTLSLKVAGIFNTGMPEIDQGLCLTPLPNVQSMYGWDSLQVSGLEIMLHSFSDLDAMLPVLENLVPYQLLILTIRDEYPDIFFWLPSLDQNAMIIIGLMLVVSLLAMSTTLLILILERTHTIGVLKTLGMNQWEIRKIFLTQAFHIVLRGIFWGNTVGLGLLAIQYFFQPLGLDRDSYYLDVVPVLWLPMSFFLLNVVTVVIAMLVLIFPSWLVSRLHPIQAIRIQ